jgi:hypothetical protein
MHPYRDNLDPDQQVELEEYIAAVMFDKFDGTEPSAQLVSRQILFSILREFRPDLIDLGL